MIKRKSRHLKWLIYPFTIIIVLGILNILFSKQILSSVDKYSIKNLRQELEKNFAPGNVDSLKLFLHNFDLDGYTKPKFSAEVKINRRNEWSLSNKFSAKLIEEEASFTSINTDIIPNDSARFYIYRKDDLRNSKVILWVPGLGVSDLAFKFIKHFFITELEKGYTVVVYIPPFHLKRKHPEKENGEGFISSNIQQNLHLQLETARELRTMLEYLEQQNPKEISAWGGSMGASFLLLTSKFHQFEHMNLMIPMIDWEHTMMQNDELKSLLPKYAKAGIDSSLLAEAFKAISPINYELNLPEKTQIQLADYDQLTDKSRILDFALKNGVDHVISYPRGHATILLSIKLYEDYEKFLEF
jgi:hypothetical protein